MVFVLRASVVRQRGVGSTDELNARQDENPHASNPQLRISHKSGLKPRLFIAFLAPAHMLCASVFRSKTGRAVGFPGRTRERNDPGGKLAKAGI